MVVMMTVMMVIWPPFHWPTENSLWSHKSGLLVAWTLTAASDRTRWRAVFWLNVKAPGMREDTNSTCCWESVCVCVCLKSKMLNSNQGLKHVRKPSEHKWWQCLPLQFLTLWWVIALLHKETTMEKNVKVEITLWKRKLWAGPEIWAGCLLNSSPLGFFLSLTEDGHQTLWRDLLSVVGKPQEAPNKNWTSRD